MKKLSESLEALGARLKRLEASATAAFEADRAKLEQRRREIDAALTADRNEWDVTVREAAAAGRSWWNETTDALARPIRALRNRHEERQSAHELHRAIRIAEAAEEDAATAMEISAHWLNVAEYAVIDATLARMVADDLILENEQTQVAGGVS